MGVGAFRVAIPLAAAVLGFLAVVAVAQPDTPARSIRRLEVVDLIRQEDERVRELQAGVRQLERNLRSLAGETETAGAGARSLRSRLDRLEILAGSAALAGPGVVVTLDDSSAPRSPTGDPNDLVVHERDIQTVVNALWAGGAEAVSVNGQRLSSLSAVRCAGNTLLLHGAVHSPPYKVTAIGDPRELEAGLPGQPGMDRLMDAVTTFGLGFDVDAGGVRVPAGSLLPSVDRAAPVA